MNQSASSNPNPQPPQSQTQQVFERNGKFGIGKDANSAHYDYSTREAAQKALTSQPIAK